MKRLRLVAALAACSSLFVVFAGCRQILGVEDPVACTDSDACDPGSDQPCVIGECVQGECVYAVREDGPAAGCVTCEDGVPVPEEGTGDPCYTGPDGTEGEGACRGGTLQCGEGDELVCEGEVVPSEELCGGAATGVDEDCDGQVDVGGGGCTCTLGEPVDCYEGPEGTEGVGTCEAGIRECEETERGTVLGECIGAIEPAVFDSCITDPDEDCSGANAECTCSHQFSVSFGGTGNEASDGIAVEADGSLLLISAFGSPTLQVGAQVLTNDGAADTEDVVLVRFDQSGNPIEAKAYGGTGFDSAVEVLVTQDGGIWIAGVLGDGTVETFGSGAALTAVGDDGYLVKLDAELNPVFKRKFGAVGEDRILALAKGPDGGVAVVGTFEQSIDVGGAQNLVAVGPKDIFVASYASDGAHRWSRRFGGNGSPNLENVQGVTIAPNGDVIITGMSTYPIDLGGGVIQNTGYDPFIARFDAEGNHIHSRLLNGAGTDFGGKAVALSDNSVWMLGNHGASLELDGDTGNGPELMAQGSGQDLFLVHYDAQGEYLSSKTFNSENSPYGPSIRGMEAGPDDAFFVATHTGATMTFDQTYTPASLDNYILKFGPDGELLCVVRISGSAAETSGEITVDDEGNFYATGGFTSTNLNLGGGTITNKGGYDMFLVKYRQ